MALMQVKDLILNERCLPGIRTGPPDEHAEMENSVGRVLGKRGWKRISIARHVRQIKKEE
jgi:hypothetical protein